MDYAMRFALALARSARRRRRTAVADDRASRCRRRTCTWSFEGPFGTYDRAQLQRGFQVYKEVCSACHSLNRVAFHELSTKPAARASPSRR